MAEPLPPLPLQPLSGCDPNLMPLPTVRIVFVFAAGIYFSVSFSTLRYTATHLVRSLRREMVDVEVPVQAAGDGNLSGKGSNRRTSPRQLPVLSPTSPSPRQQTTSAPIPLQQMHVQVRQDTRADPKSPLRPPAVIQFPHLQQQGRTGPGHRSPPHSPTTEAAGPNSLSEPSIQTRRRLRPISEMHSRTFYFFAKTIMALAFTINALANLMITFPSTVRRNRCQSHAQLMQAMFQLGYAMAMGVMLARADHILGISKWSKSHRPIHIFSWLIYVAFGIADIFTISSEVKVQNLKDSGPFCGWEPSPILYMAKRVFDLCIEMYVCFVCFNALWIRRERAEFNTTKHFIQALAVSYVPRATVLILVVLMDIYVTAADVFTPTVIPFFWIVCNGLIMLFVAYDDLMFKVVMGRVQRKRQRMRGGKWAKNAAAAAAGGGAPHADGGSLEPTELVVHTDQLTRPVGTLDDTALMTTDPITSSTEPRPDRYTAAAYGGGIRYSLWGRGNRDRNRDGDTQSSGSAETVITDAAVSPEMIPNPSSTPKGAGDGPPLRSPLPPPSATTASFVLGTSPTSTYPHSIPSPQHPPIFRTSFMGADSSLGNRQSPSLHSLRQYSHQGSGVSSASGSGSVNGSGVQHQRVVVTNSPPVYFVDTLPRPGAHAVHSQAMGSSPTTSTQGLLLTSGVSSFASGSVSVATPGIASSPHGSLVWDEQRSVAILDTLEGSPLSEARRLVAAQTGSGSGSGLSLPTNSTGTSSLGMAARRDLSGK